MGSLLADGIDIRLAGQDTRRGTFSQRHSVLVDYDTGAEYVPLGVIGTLGVDDERPGGVGTVRSSENSNWAFASQLRTGERAGAFRVFDSLLSEYAALGFEYGYSVEAGRSLVAWEAQFGDFVNGAQIVIDNFIAAAGEKWGQQSALVMLLPHGFEGQGPEHSSARLERFLQACAGGNMTVAQPTNAAQYFHLLRAQVLRTDRRPLVVMTPKSLLRARQARSAIGLFVEGGFEEVLDDPAVTGGTLDPAGVTRVVLCSGKVAYDAMHRREVLAAAADHIAVVRVEQLHPWPAESLLAVLDRYDALEEVVWLQEEPENMGAWTYVHGWLHRILRERATLTHVSRQVAGSPATGSATIHQLELAGMLDAAVAPLAE
jgi:2-oxoglutarate dehydrogenase E1 component